MDSKNSHSDLQVFALGQSVAVAIQCANGLGQHIGTLSDGEIEKILKVSTSSF